MKPYIECKVTPERRYEIWVKGFPDATSYERIYNFGVHHIHDAMSTMKDFKSAIEIYGSSKSNSIFTLSVLRKLSELLGPPLMVSYCKKCGAPNDYIYDLNYTCTGCKLWIAAY